MAEAAERTRPRGWLRYRVVLYFVAGLVALDAAIASRRAVTYPVACRMAVDSYRQGRTLKWDAGKEEMG